MQPVTCLNQSDSQKLFILEPNYFCFCDKFFCKLVFDPLFLGKLFKLDEPDTQDIAGEAEMNS